MYIFHHSPSFSFGSMTSQWPPLSGPTRRIMPCSRKFFMCFSTAFTEILRDSASSDWVIPECSFIISIIFSLLFSLLSSLLSSTVSSLNAELSRTFTINSTCLYSGSGLPASAISRNIRSTPSPNSFTSLYRCINWTIFGLREKCIWRILSIRTMPGRMPGLSTT